MANDYPNRKSEDDGQKDPASRIAKPSDEEAGSLVDGSQCGDKKHCRENLKGSDHVGIMEQIR